MHVPHLFSAQSIKDNDHKHRSVAAAFVGSRYFSVVQDHGRATCSTSRGRPTHPARKSTSVFVIPGVKLAFRAICGRRIWRVVHAVVTRCRFSGDLLRFRFVDRRPESIHLNDRDREHFITSHSHFTSSTMIHSGRFTTSRVVDLTARKLQLSALRQVCINEGKYVRSSRDSVAASKAFQGFFADWCKCLCARQIPSCRPVTVKAQPARRSGYVSASDDDEVCQDDFSGIWNCQLASESSEMDVMQTRQRSRETLEPMQLAARLLLEHGMGLKSGEAELMHSR